MYLALPSDTQGGWQGHFSDPSFIFLLSQARVLTFCYTGCILRLHRSSLLALLVHAYYSTHYRAALKQTKSKMAIVIQAIRPLALGDSSLLSLM